MIPVISNNSVNPDTIFSNNEMSLQDIEIYGFDYDYTLAFYSSQLHNLIFNIARDILITKHRVGSRVRWRSVIADLHGYRGSVDLAKIFWVMEFVKMFQPSQPACYNSQLVCSRNLTISSHVFDCGCAKLRKPATVFLCKLKVTADTISC